MVDIGAIVSPAVPEIAQTLNAAGVTVPLESVQEVISGIDPLTIRESGTEPYMGPASPVAARFGTATLLSALVMIGSGSIAIAASRDRLVEVRRLMTRLALAGISFAILLQLGSWILDPGGGRAPIEESVSLLLSSKWSVPAAVAGVAAIVALALWLFGRWFTPVAMSPPTVESTTRPPAQVL